MDDMKKAYEDGNKKGKQAGSFEYQIEKKKQISEDKATAKQEEKDRIEKLKQDKVPYCPKCKSASVTFVNKKLSIGRAVAGGLIAGETGAKLGGFTSKKGKMKCLNCGKEWKI